MLPRTRNDSSLRSNPEICMGEKKDQSARVRHAEREGAPACEVNENRTKSLK